MLLTEEYRDLLATVHRKNSSFGRGSKHRNEFVKSLGYKDVLDYGCGKGNLRANKRYDPAIKEFSADPDPADLVVCTDVLEHIEPECLDKVLRHIQSKVLKAGYFAISCSPAKKTLPDGRNAHLIVESPEWWLQKLSDYFVVEKSSFHADERRKNKHNHSVELEVHLRPKG